MATSNFNTSNQTLRQLLGNGLTYRIPRFQRDYSWTQDQWEDLWMDLEEMLAGAESGHYMGYLVLQTNDSKTFDVIDGQQRLTTLSLLVLAALKAIDTLISGGIDAENNTQRRDQLRNSYIGFVDPVSLIPQTKLTLNRNNDRFYRDYLVPLEKVPQRKLRASQHLLRNAFEWFVNVVSERYKKQNDGRAYAQFISDIADRLFFTVITVSDELNAFTVFETLNARGVKLSPTDLIKNYLFSVVARNHENAVEIDDLEEKWEEIVTVLGGESFPNFLRVHWNSRRRIVRESALFKTIRNETPDRGAVFSLLRDMNADVGTYVALSNPEDALWDSEQRISVDELRMFSVRQPWPMLLAARREFDGSELTKLLRACSVASFRYNVIGALPSNDQERVYNDVAQRISSGVIKTSAEAIQELRTVYPTDDVFKSAFSEKVLSTASSRNNKIARYILFRLEEHVSGQHYDRDSAQYSLEHILPQHPSDAWATISEDALRGAVSRLGNLTLLSRKVNKNLGNAPFPEKRPFYAEERFELTRLLAVENEEWTLARLARRQRWMAAQATAIWRIPQLSAVS